MDENELVEAVFEQLVGGAVEFGTGIPLSPVSLFTRFANWLDEGNDMHKRAVSKAIDKYRRSGFYSDFQSRFNSDFRS